MTTTKLTVTSLALAGATEAIDAGAGQARDRELRFRKLTIAPGGVVPWHSHADRPALIYVAEGEIHEFASNVVRRSFRRRATCAAKQAVSRTGARSR
jgi:uncharacterized RmlC-like cupin family protein